MFCPKCSAGLLPGAQFCGACGERLDAGGGARPPQPPQQPFPQTPPPQQQQPFPQPPPARAGRGAATATKSCTSRLSRSPW
jgi:zinc-ribbon domain